MAVTAVSFNELPFISPIFSGEKLFGYNYFLDLIIFLLSKVGISSSIAYFKILPLVWFALFTYAAVALGRKIKDSPLFIALLLFFFYFGGSFSYLLTLYHQQTIWGSSGILVMQSGLMMSNLQFAFSLVILLYAILLILKKEIDLKKTFILSLLVFLSLGLKFYGGAVITFLTVIFFLESILSGKNLVKKFKYLSVFIFSAVVAVVVFYNPFSSFKTGSVLSFDPLATVHPIIEEPGLVYLQNMVDARYFLETKGIGPRLIGIELLTIFIFILFNLGTRFFGFFYLAKQLIKNKISRMDVYLILSMIFSAFLAMFFVQKGQWWNTIQFFYYTIFLSSFFAAKFLYEIMNKKNMLTISIGAIIIILTLPTSIDLLRGFSAYPAPSYVPAEEIQALKFLKSQPEGTVFFPLNQNKEKSPDPQPLYAYEDNSYVAAFSGQKLYFADIVQLQLTGVNYKERLNRIKETDCSILEEINYFYQIKPMADRFFNSCYSIDKFKKIYENDLINIYRIKHYD